MKFTTLSSSSFFFICLSLILFAVSPALSVPLYETLCKLTRQDANDCLILLKSDARITSATNYHDLSKFILDLAVTTSISVQAYLGKVETDFPNDQAIKQCAQQFYPKTIAAFKSALDELDKDPQGAKNDIQAAGNGPGFCEKALQREKFDNPPIHVRNNQIFVISEVAFLSVNHLT
ncbi:unnamed protein product [Lathyrus sativus]|nr:unnamed protein product [Lathyrus sativus]